MAAQFHNRPLGDLVDELGALKAAIADLKARETTLVDALKESGETAIEGALFRAIVVESIAATLDTRAIREAMGEAWCARFTRRTASLACRVTARNGNKRAA
jgi:hypothetical protein